MSNTKYATDFHPSLITPYPARNKKLGSEQAKHAWPFPAIKHEIEVKSKTEPKVDKEHKCMNLRIRPCVMKFDNLSTKPSFPANETKAEQKTKREKPQRKTLR